MRLGALERLRRQLSYANVRRSLLFAALLLAVLVVTSTATAAKPVKGPCTLCTPAATFPAGFVCPFAFSYEDVVDKRFQILYSNGLIRIAGHRVIRVTNEETQESRIFALNAMISFVFDGARVVTTSSGPFLWGFLAGDLGAGQPGALLYTQGRAQEIDEYPGPHPNAFGFTTLSFEVNGTSENLCETMA